MNKQSALWSILFIVLLLLSFSQLTILTISFLMVPVVVMFVKLTPQRFAFAYILCLLVIYVVSYALGAGAMGTIASMFALFFLVPSVVIGTLYKRRASARSVLTAGTITMLAQLLLFLLLLTLFGVQVIDEIRQFMKGSLETLPAEVRSMLPADFMDQIIDLMVKLMPLYLIGFSAYYTVVTHWLARKVLVRGGEPIPGLRPAKEWMLPKSMIWYYLIALVLSYIFVNPDNSMVFMILWNLIPIMMFAFTVQAFAFFFFLADLRGWSAKVPKALAVAGVLLVLMIPGLMHLFSLLGLFDVAFPIRERLKKS